MLPGGEAWVARSGSKRLLLLNIALWNSSGKMNDLYCHNSSKPYFVGGNEWKVVRGVGDDESVRSAGVVFVGGELLQPVQTDYEDAERFNGIDEQIPVSIHFLQTKFTWWCYWWYRCRRWYVAKKMAKTQATNSDLIEGVLVDRHLGDPTSVPHGLGGAGCVARPHTHALCQNLFEFGSGPAGDQGSY